MILFRVQKRRQSQTPCRTATDSMRRSLPVFARNVISFRIQAYPGFEPPSKVSTNVPTKVSNKDFFSAAEPPERSQRNHGSDGKVILLNFRVKKYGWTIHEYLVLKRGTGVIFQEIWINDPEKYRDKPGITGEARGSAFSAVKTASLPKKSRTEGHRIRSSDPASASVAPLLRFYAGSVVPPSPAPARPAAQRDVSPQDGATGSTGTTGATESTGGGTVVPFAGATESTGSGATGSVALAQPHGIGKWRSTKGLFSVLKREIFERH